MSSQESSSPKSKLTAGIPSMGAAIFDDLALVYDNWFEEEGKLIFAIEIRASLLMLVLW